MEKTLHVYKGMLKKSSKQNIKHLSIFEIVFKPYYKIDGKFVIEKAINFYSKKTHKKKDISLCKAKPPSEVLRKC